MSQYVFTMHRLGKVVPPKREILKDISLSFFPRRKNWRAGSPMAQVNQHYYASWPA